MQTESFSFQTPFVTFRQSYLKLRDRHFSSPIFALRIRWITADTEVCRESASWARASDSRRVTNDTTRSDRTSSCGFGGRPNLCRIVLSSISVMRHSNASVDRSIHSVLIYIAGIICNDLASQHQEFARRIGLNSATPRPETPIQVVRQRFSSFDQFAEAIDGWDLDWHQLDRGRLDATLLHVAGGSATFEHVAFNRSFAQRTGSPSGRLTLGLIENTVGAIGWCRQNVSHDDLLVFSPGGENECVSKPGFRGHLVSYSEEYLERTAENLGLSVNLGLYREGGVALQLDSATAEDLRHRFHRFGSIVTTCLTDAEKQWIRHELETEMAARLLFLLAADPPTTCERIDGFKMRAVQRARDYIDIHATEPPTILQVGQAAGVSWRSLNYAFREVFGVTPKQYLQATRLNGVRKQLRRRGPGSTVADIANRWGFWHMGQFAADYKRQFGELPSKTPNSRM